MKVSKVELVGQIRRRSGISMKIRMKPQTLKIVSAREKGGKGWAGGVQQDYTPDDDDVEVEDVGYAECEA